MESALGTRVGRRAVRILVGAALAAGALALGAGQARADTLPGPVFSSGPADGATIPDTAVDFAFALDPSLSGGTLAGFLCSIDGGTFVDCDSPIHLADLSVGTHSLAVKASLTLLGGGPICILTFCVDPGPLTIETGVSTTGFTVTAMAGPAGGTGTNGSNGANGANTATNNSALASLKAQQARCKKLRVKLHKHFAKRSNRARVHRRYLKCLKVQRRLARGATVSAL